MNKSNTERTFFFFKKERQSISNFVYECFSLFFNIKKEKKRKETIDIYIYTLEKKNHKKEWEN